MIEPQPIRLYDLTEHQKELCDLLWDCHSESSVRFMLDFVLDDEDRLTALTLIEMMHMEVAERDGDFAIVKPVVDEFLNKIITGGNNA